MDSRVNGWGVFAGLMLVMIGAFNVIQGMVAIFSPERLFVTGEKLVVLDFDRWGWVLLIWGIIMAAGGAALLNGATWARAFAITLAMLHAVGQLTLIGVQPFLSLLLIGLDIGVIWGLTAGWASGRVPESELGAHDFDPSTYQRPDAATYRHPGA